MPAPRIHPFFRLAICAAGIVGCVIVMSLMLLVGTALASVWTGRQNPDQLANLVYQYALPLGTLIYPSLLLWIAYCRTGLDRRSVTSLGYHRSEWAANSLRGALTGFLSIALLWNVLWLSGFISVSCPSPEASDAGPFRSVANLIGYLLMFIVVALFEESLFRGYTLHNLNEWLGWRYALIAQAVIFAAAHLGNVGPDISTLLADPGGAHDAERLAVATALCALPNIGLIAVFFALAYRKTGSLWFPIGFHTAWNFCLGCVFSLPVSSLPVFRLLDVRAQGPWWLSGGSFGPEGSLLLIPIILVQIVVMSRLPDHPTALVDFDPAAEPDLVPAKKTTEEEAIEEENRQRRYRTTFRSGETFSAETLRQLNDLQEKRRREAEIRAERQKELEEKAEKVAAFDPEQEARLRAEEPAYVAPEPERVLAGTLETDIPPAGAPARTATSSADVGDEATPPSDGAAKPAAAPVPVRKAGPRW